MDFKALLIDSYKNLYCQSVTKSMLLLTVFPFSDNNPQMVQAAPMLSILI